jgi:hypothetical protein
LVIAACTTTRVEPTPPIPEGATHICEPCVGELSGERVGVGNVWKRALPGADGGAAVLQESAHLSIWSVDSGAERGVYVVVGSDVILGGDTYRVVRIDDPKGSQGGVVLVKVNR